MMWVLLALPSIGLALIVGSPSFTKVISLRALSADKESAKAETGINKVLDDWHQAAAAAEEERYFRHMAASAVFMGTDPTERWTKAAFQKWAHPYFAKGKAWSFKPKQRLITLHADGKVAWFDEMLDTPNLGLSRGSGVMVLEEKEWRIAQYNLSVPVPNDLFPEVKKIIDAGVKKDSK
jgi:hypothetical protein